MPARPRIKTVTYSKESKKGPCYTFSPEKGVYKVSCIPKQILSCCILDSKYFDSILNKLAYDGGNPVKCQNTTILNGISFTPQCCNILDSKYFDNILNKLAYDGGSPVKCQNTILLSG